MDDKKIILVISLTVPYSRAEFFEALKQFEENGINVCYVNKVDQVIHTENAHIRFMSRRQSLEGYHCDEIFGYRDKYIEERLKDPKKPRYSGSLVEYMKKLDENARTDAFLKSELEKDRARK